MANVDIAIERRFTFSLKLGQISKQEVYEAHTKKSLNSEAQSYNPYIPFWQSIPPPL